MTRLTVLPCGNLIDVLVANLILAKGAVPITDAQLQVNVLDETRAAVIGPLAMVAEVTPSTQVSNSYRASFDSTGLTEHASYVVQVIGQNYTVEWEESFQCKRRPFGM